METDQCRAYQQIEQIRYSNDNIYCHWACCGDAKADVAYVFYFFELIVDLELVLKGNNKYLY